MIRKIGNYEVVQRTKDGYFSATSLLESWNSVHGNPRRDIDKFFQSTKTKEFQDALIKELSFPQKCEKADIQLVKKSRKKTSGRTKTEIYMNPYLFTKFAMWINPTFEAKVVIFVTDQMIKYRNDAGDAYRELGSAVGKIVAKDLMPKAMKKIGEALNWIIFNSHEKELRNKHGDEPKMRELYEFEKKVASLINEDFIRSYSQLMDYLRNQYSIKNNPIASLG